MTIIKTISAILTLTAFNALATDAILNVEGQIQVNGKTVINNNGELTSSTIDINDYLQGTGEYVYSFTSDDEVCTLNESVQVTNSGRTVTSTDECDANYNYSATTTETGETWDYTTTGESQEIEYIQNELIVKKRALIPRLGKVTFTSQEGVVTESISAWNMVADGSFPYTNRFDLSFDDCISMISNGDWGIVMCKGVGSVKNLTSYSQN